MAGKNCNCNNLGPAARPISLAGNGGAYIAQTSALFDGIGNKSIAGLGQGYTPGYMGDFLSIDMKPFILIGALFLGYQILKKKHA
jgi:hypothetical protein